MDCQQSLRPRKHRSCDVMCVCSVAQSYVPPLGKMYIRTHAFCCARCTFHTGIDHPRTAGHLYFSSLSAGSRPHARSLSLSHHRSIDPRSRTLAPSTHTRMAAHGCTPDRGTAGDVKINEHYCWHLRAFGDSLHAHYATPRRQHKHTLNLPTRPMSCQQRAPVARAPHCGNTPACSLHNQ